MTYLTGAFRLHNYPADKFISDPLYDAPVLETAHVWRDVVAMAAAGNGLAQKVVAIGKALNARKLAAHGRVAVPAWAQEILSPILDEYQTENLDDAMAALSRALA
jgi:hypothetical protein